MPQMDGIELLHGLVALRPATQVIVMSGFPDDAPAQWNLTPVVPMLEKTFHPQRLLSLMGRGSSQSAGGG